MATAIVLSEGPATAPQSTAPSQERSNNGGSMSPPQKHNSNIDALLNELALSPPSAAASPLQNNRNDANNNNNNNNNNNGNNEEEEVQQQQQQQTVSSTSAAAAAALAKLDAKLEAKLQEQQQHSAAHHNHHHHHAPANTPLGELQTNLVMQDRIISTLESDNQRLIQENKSLRTKLRDAQQVAARASVVSNNKSNSNSRQQSDEAAATSSPSSSSPPGAAVASTKAQQQQQQQSPEAALSVAALQAQLEQQREDMEAERKDMTRKISWYIDRQEVGAAQDALIAEQQQQVRDLRLQVADLEAQVLAHSMPAKSDKDKQIRQLNRRVFELDEALRSRNPDSLTELIRASRPPLTEAAEFKRMKAQLDEANARLEEREEAAQRAIAQLRVESDALRTNYQKRLEKVGEEMKLRIAATQTRKTKELEKQLNDTRRFYSEKVKELEQALAGYRRGEHNSNTHKLPTRIDSDHPPHFTAPTSSFVMQQQYVDPTPAPSMARSARSSSSSAPRSSSSTRANSNKNQQDNNDKNNNQQQSNNQQNNNNNNNNGMTMMNPAMWMNQPYPMVMTPNGPMMMQQQPPSQHQQVPMMMPYTDPSLQQRIWFLETRTKSLEEENRFLQKTASESVLSTGAAAAVQAQLAESQREIVTLQRLLKESQELQRKTVHELDERLHNEREDHSRELERLTSNQRDEMKALQTRCDAEIRLRSDSVTARQLMAFSSGLSNVMGTDLGANASTGELRKYLLLLAERVHCLERQLAAAESEHTRMLAEVKRVAEFELQVEKQKMGVALKQKNAEIDGFKVQLDSMLDQISKMKRK